MTRNIKLLMEYDGTNFAGWQRQHETAGPSIQGIIEQALEKIVGHSVDVISAGRTDAGVHAAAQVANFRTGSQIPVDRLPRALAGLLPADIAIKGAWEVADDFHARHSAVEKTYRYTIYQSEYPSVFNRRYVYHFRYPLDFNAMKIAATCFVGTHDFTSFCARGTSVKNFVRTVKSCELEQVGEYLYFDITANGFLYKMVRNIVGTLIEVGRGKITSESIKAILEAKDRTCAGPTAPAQGLMLMNVCYDDN